MPDNATIAAVAARIAARTASRTPVLVGVTGSVAVGKSTFCDALRATLAITHPTALASTDGFLLTNATLDARGLTLRKGFPESYDVDALFAALADARAGSVTLPVYSHTTYDVDPASAVRIDSPAILVFEGLALAPFPDGRNPRSHLDLLIYLDASEADLETWFVARFMGLWRAAETDPSSYYTRFRGLSAPDAEAFARTVWTRINLPNLRDHIVHARPNADLVLHKTGDHQWRIVHDAPA